MAVHGVHRRLRWSDFRRVDESPDGHDAQTFVDFDVQTRFSIDHLGAWKITHVTIKLTLNHRGTWVVHGRQNNDLLAHEQRHYDIAAIAARTLDRRLSGLHGQGDAKKQTEIRTQLQQQTLQITHEILGESTPDGRVVSVGLVQEVQDRYDEDAICGSDHGLNRERQSLWTLSISRALANVHADISELNSCPRPSASGSVGGE